MTKFSAYFLSLLLLFSTSVFAQNVGIGTTTPVNTLSVNGKVDITDSLGIGTTTPANKLSVNGNTDIFGKLGIRTNMPNGELHVISKIYSTGIADQSSGLNTSQSLDYFLWQSFTAGTTGLLKTVILRLGTIQPILSLPAELKIYSGEGNSGILLSTTPVMIQPTGNFSTSMSFDIGFPSEVIAGGIYTFELSTTTGDYFYASSSNSNTYTRGRSNRGINRDFVFTTFVAPHIGDNNSIVVNNGMVGINTIAPTEMLDVAGTTKTTNLQITNGASNGFILKSDANGNASWVNANLFSETDPKVGTLSSNKIPKWNGTTLTDGLIFDSGANVGIGTITPTQKLDVAGTTRTSSLQITNGAANDFILKSDANGNASWINASSVETDPKVGALTSNKIPKWNGTTLTDGLVFDNGANVGIGTVTPTQRLDVSGTTKTTNLQITGGASNGFVLKSDSSGNASWVNVNTLAYTETDPKVGTLTSNKIPKWNGTTLADGTIFDNGNKVGIGTTTPVGELHVKSVVTSNSIIDQQQTVRNGSAAGLVNWQSFTAGATGLLTRVDLGVSSPLDGPSAGTIKIFMGEGNSGTVLSTTAVTFQDVNNSFQSFTLSSFPAVITGNKYTIEFSVTAVIIGWLDDNNSNPYAGGRSNLNNATDYLFKTYVASELADGLVVADAKAKVDKLQITSGAANGFILKSDASGNASWVNANTLTVIETDPKVGTLTSNNIPKWNGTTLANGLVYDNGVNVGIGTNNPSNKFTVVQPSGIGVTELSGIATANTSIGIGRTAVEGTLNIAAGNGQFSTNAVAGDLILRTETTSNRLILNNGSGAAALTVNNGNVGVGTSSPSNKLTVVQPSGIGLAALSGETTDYASIGIGRSVVEGTLNVAAFQGQFASDARSGDLILRTQNPDRKVILNNGGSAAVLTVTDGKVGVSTSSPETELDVNGGIRTKYSGTIVIAGTVGIITLDITMPNALPANWDNTNTMAVVINGDGAEGFVRSAKITSPTNIRVRLQQDQSGFIRLNWVVLKL